MNTPLEKKKQEGPNVKEILELTFESSQNIKKGDFIYLDVTGQWTSDAGSIWSIDDSIITWFPNKDNKLKPFVQGKYLGIVEDTNGDLAIEVERVVDKQKHQFYLDPKNDIPLGIILEKKWEKKHRKVYKKAAEALNNFDPLDMMQCIAANNIRLRIVEDDDEDKDKGKKLKKGKIKQDVDILKKDKEIEKEWNTKQSCPETYIPTTFGETVYLKRPTPEIPVGTPGRIIGINFDEKYKVGDDVLVMEMANEKLNKFLTDLGFPKILTQTKKGKIISHNNGKYTVSYYEENEDVTAQRKNSLETFKEYLNNHENVSKHLETFQVATGNTWKDLEERKGLGAMLFKLNKILSPDPSSVEFIADILNDAGGDYQSALASILESDRHLSQNSEVLNVGNIESGWSKTLAGSDPAGVGYIIPAIQEKNLSNSCLFPNNEIVPNPVLGSVAPLSIYGFQKGDIVEPNISKDGEAFRKTITKIGFSKIGEEVTTKASWLWKESVATVNRKLNIGDKEVEEYDPGPEDFKIHYTIEELFPNFNAKGNFEIQQNTQGMVIGFDNWIDKSQDYMENWYKKKPKQVQVVFQTEVEIKGTEKLEMGGMEEMQRDNEGKSIKPFSILLDIFISYSPNQLKLSNSIRPKQFFPRKQYEDEEKDYWTVLDSENQQRCAINPYMATHWSGGRGESISDLEERTRYRNSSIIDRERMTDGLHDKRGFPESPGINKERSGENFVEVDEHSLLYLLGFPRDIWDKKQTGETGKTKGAFPDRLDCLDMYYLVRWYPTMGSKYGRAMWINRQDFIASKFVIAPYPEASKTAKENGDFRPPEFKPPGRHPEGYLGPIIRINFNKGEFLLPFSGFAKKLPESNPWYNLGGSGETSTNQQRVIYMIIDIESLEKKLQEQSCRVLKLWLRALYPSGLDYPAISNTKTPLVNTIIKSIFEGRYRFLMWPQRFFAEDARHFKNSHILNNFWEFDFNDSEKCITKFVAILNRTIIEKGTDANNAYEPNTPVCKAEGLITQTYGSGRNDCPPGKRKVKVKAGKRFYDCCQDIEDKLTFIQVKNIKASCEGCSEEKKKLLNEDYLCANVEQEHADLTRYISTLRMNKKSVNWFVQSIEKIQALMVEKLSKKFEDIFDLLSVDSCDDEITKEFIDELNTGEWKNKTWSNTSQMISKLFTGVKNFAKISGNFIAYAIYAIYTLVKHFIGGAYTLVKRIGKIIGGATKKVWSIGRTIATFMVFSPKQTKVIAYALNVMKKASCKFIGRYLLEYPVSWGVEKMREKRTPIGSLWNLINPSKDTTGGRSLYKRIPAKDSKEYDRLNNMKNDPFVGDIELKKEYNRLQKEREDTMMEKVAAEMDAYAKLKSQQLSGGKTVTKQIQDIEAKKNNTIQKWKNKYDMLVSQKAADIVDLEWQNKAKRWCDDDKEKGGTECSYSNWTSWSDNTWDWDKAWDAMYSQVPFREKLLEKLGLKDDKTEMDTEDNMIWRDTLFDYIGCQRCKEGPEGYGYSGVFYKSLETYWKEQYPISAKKLDKLKKDLKNPNVLLAGEEGEAQKNMDELRRLTAVINKAGFYIPETKTSKDMSMLPEWTLKPWVPWTGYIAKAGENMDIFEDRVKNTYKNYVPKFAMDHVKDGNVVTSTALSGLLGVITRTWVGLEAVGRGVGEGVAAGVGAVGELYDPSDPYGNIIDQNVGNKVSWDEENKEKAEKLVSLKFLIDHWTKDWDKSNPEEAQKMAELKEKIKQNPDSHRFEVEMEERLPTVFEYIEEEVISKLRPILGRIGADDFVFGKEVEEKPRKVWDNETNRYMCADPMTPLERASKTEKFSINPARASANPFGENSGLPYRPAPGFTKLVECEDIGGDSTIKTSLDPAKEISTQVAEKAEANEGTVFGELVKGGTAAVTNVAGAIAHPLDVMLPLAEHGGIQKSFDSIIKITALGGGSIVSLVPFVGPLLGVATGFLIEGLGEVFKEVGIQYLHIAAYQTDIRQSIDNLTQLFDINVCLNEIPQIKRRFPTLSWYLKTMKHYSDIARGYVSGTPKEIEQGEKLIEQQHKKDEQDKDEIAKAKDNVVIKEVLEEVEPTELVSPEAQGLLLAQTGYDKDEQEVDLSPDKRYNFDKGWLAQQVNAGVLDQVPGGALDNNFYFYQEKFRDGEMDPEVWNSIRMMASSIPPSGPS